MGESVLINDGEMLQALYDFKATFAKTLSFHEGDKFILHQINTKQKNWWQVIDSKAQVGYVPSNYVSTLKVPTQCIVDFLNICLSSMRSEELQSGGSLGPDRQELYVRLAELKQRLESDNCNTLKRVSTHTSSNKNITTAAGDTANIVEPKQSPTHSSDPNQGKGDFEKHGVYIHNSRERSNSRSNVGASKATNANEENNPRKETLNATNSTPAPAKKEKVPANDDTIKKRPKPREPETTKDVELSAKQIYLLVEQVRCHTQLSHELSRVAVAVVTRFLRQALPSSVDGALSSLLEQVERDEPLNVPSPLIDETHDARRLRVIFAELASCKEDSQQRSWMLYEDEPTILEYINELASILSNADKNISRHVMALEQYLGVTSLIQYYQMEVRWSIRQRLLTAFGAMCSLDKTVVAIILNSVLPMELARDMKANSRNIPRLNYSSLLLTMVFSMGEPMPVTHLEYLGPDFISFLLDLIESPPDTDVDEEIPDIFLNLILAYNLQFPSPAENVVVKALLKRPVAKTFTEKILLLLNREVDPVRTLEHTPEPIHSVIKMMGDLFTSQQTALLFYTNDIKVLIDIVVRQLADLSPGDLRRGLYLELCRLVMRNTAYGEHCHRRDDILKCFTRIFCEESELSREDQARVRDISNEFPHYFKT